MKGAPNKLSRRRFLLAAAGGAATGATLVVKSSDDAQLVTKEKPRASKGYQLTDHVRNYYRTAKV